MKRFLRSKFSLTLVAFLMVSAAIAIPLSNNIIHSHAAPSSSQASWHIVSSPSPSTSSNNLLAVSAYDVNNAWAVGTYSDTNSNLHDLIEHWNGTNWSLQTGANPGVNRNILNGVKAFSATNIWAVGSYDGNVLIEHTTDGGSTWAQDTNSYEGNGSLNAIDGDPSSGDAWAVGTDNNTNALTLHLVNGHFSSQANVSPSYGTLVLNGVSEHSSSDVWAVGSYLYGGGYHNIDTMHYDGNSWTEYSDPISSYSTGENYLSGVIDIGTDNAWAVGAVGPVYDDYIDHWNGSGWNQAQADYSSCRGSLGGLSSVASSASNNIWAAGYVVYSSNYNNYLPLICHSSDGGSTWEQSSVDNPSSSQSYNALNGISFSNDNSVGWVVGIGDNSNTLIEQYTPPSPPSIIVNPTQGQLGTMVNITGSGWTPGDVVDISLSTSASVLTKATVAGDGTFSASFTVPENAATGPQFVNAKDEITGQTAQASFTVTRPFNSAVNNLTADATTTQSETSVAVSSVNSPGLTVMVGYNDDNPISAGYTGYSYSFDGGTSWTDAGALPVYKDSTGLLGYNGGDPVLAVDNNGTFYFAQVAFTYQHAEFISMSTCRYSSSTGKIGCGRPRPVSGLVDGKLHFNDKPGIVYDPVNNRVYVTWTEFVHNASNQLVKVIPKLRYYNISTNSFSTTYSLPSFPNGNGTAPVVTSSGMVYVFFLQQTAQGLGKAIVYFTFNNGTITFHTLANILPAANIVSACVSPDGQEAFIKEAFDISHAARTNELPAAAIDSSGNIDVVWEAAPSNGGISTIFVATLPSGGGTPTIQSLPNPNNLIQWQPAIAFAGGTNALAVTYFQVVNTASGYQIERDQVNASASSNPTFGSAFPISTVSWKADKTNLNFDPNAGVCYMGDYSASTSTSTANVVWSYWGDNRNITSGGDPQPDVYGLFVSVP